MAQMGKVPTGIFGVGGIGCLTIWNRATTPEMHEASVLPFGESPSHKSPVDDGEFISPSNRNSILKLRRRGAIDAVPFLREPSNADVRHVEEEEDSESALW